MFTLKIGRLALQWRRNRLDLPEAIPTLLLSKLTEEVGEVARAVVGKIEDREDRGYIVEEAAQVIFVLSMLVEYFYPGVDLGAEVEADMFRLGAFPENQERNDLDL